jgi:flagellar L-ring protein FlgH
MAARQFIQRDTTHAARPAAARLWPRRGLLLSALAAGQLCAFSGLASGQGLLTRPAEQAPLEGAVDAATPLYTMSMIAVRPPEKRTYKVHDLVQIIINESSQQSSEQRLETEKETQRQAEIRALVDFKKLLELRIRQGDLEAATLLDTRSAQEYSGEGEYERRDRFTDRITASIIDIKPNGMLVLEARRSIQTDEEIKVLVLSGMCMADAVTQEGIVQSSELADLRVIVNNEGALRKASSKGWITKALDFLFPF